MRDPSAIPPCDPFVDRGAGSPRTLVLHADDFGMNEAVTNGILEGFRRGLLTSTSVLANAPNCARALARWKELQSAFAADALPSCQSRRLLSDSVSHFDLGIHLNLTQGRPLTGQKYPVELLDARGLFPGVAALGRRLLIGGWRFRSSLELELKAQIEVLLDHGISPTHLNAHQYVDLLPVVASLIPPLLVRYAIPVARVPWERNLTQATLLRRFEPLNWCLGQVKRIFAFRHLLALGRKGIPHPAGYFGTSHAGRIDLAQMLLFIHAARSGLTEIGMHPGCPVPSEETTVDGEGWYDPLAALRPKELALLTSPELPLMLEMHQIRLGRLSELAAPRSLSAAA
ncbi:MAG: ChbG/HpnK family deacetylase [Planctomycetia bacterium]|nr:ChbG/HpnK family deacetylase [Planctomycetia bacterium]